jgi:Arc/MetJ family transcription regulator
MPMRRISRQPSARFTRRSFFVDEGAIRRARRVLGVHTNAEAVRLAVERVVEMEEFWRFMTRSRASLKPESIEVP